MDSVHSRRQHSLSKAPTQHAHRWWLGCDDAASRKCKCTRNVELEVRTAFVRRCFLVGRATMASSCTSEELASNASTTSSSSCMRLVTRARRLCQELPKGCVRLRAHHRLQHCAMFCAVATHRRSAPVLAPDGRLARLPSRDRLRGTRRCAVRGAVPAERVVAVDWAAGEEAATIGAAGAGVSMTPWPSPAANAAGNRS